MTLVTYDRSKAILLSHNLNFLNMETLQTHLLT